MSFIIPFKVRIGFDIKFKNSISCFSLDIIYLMGFTWVFFGGRG